MDTKKILATSLLFFSLNSYGVTYHSNQQGHYVTSSQLYNVFQKVKRTSNISTKALAKTFHYYEKNRYRKHLSPDYLAIADYTKLASQKRLFIINLHTGRVRKHLVAHGLKSGAKGGRVWRASNKEGSLKTPTGFFKVGSKEGTTWRKKYKYLGIEGLEWKNRNARKREIILHTASYVAKGGRSYGCFAIKPQDRWQVFSRLKRALLFSYVGK